MARLVLAPILILTSFMRVAPAVAADSDPKPLEIGQPAPDFDLPGVDGKNHQLAEYREAKILVVVFTCNHCPTAQAYDDRISKLDKDFKDKGVKLIAISPNDPKALRLDELGYTEFSDGFDEMKIRAKDKDFKFPYLYDGENQKVSRAFGVLATPHVFIFDADRKLRYQGRIDNSDVHEVTSRDAQNAIEALLAGKPVPVETTRVFGCSTKWSDKRQTVVDSLKKWDDEPVALETIDPAGVAKLAKNDTDKLLLVNVWATWCGPCVEELPQLVEMNRMYRRRPGHATANATGKGDSDRPFAFEFVTISLDEASDKAAALAELKTAHASGSNYLFDNTDRDKLADALDPKWSGPVPFTALIAPGGKVIYRHSGPIEPVEVKRAIVDFLGRTYAEKKDPKEPANKQP
ncbi:MAG TPA: redoxin domain-containing protein [Pirellulales bacterium]